MTPFEVDIDGKKVRLELDDKNTTARINGNEIRFSIVDDNLHRMLIRVGTKLYQCNNITVTDSLVSFSLNGQFCKAKVKGEEQLLLEKLGFNNTKKDQKGIIMAPMPGKVLEIPVEVGDEVREGQSILILEAMKMENELKATVSGVVRTIHLKSGDNVEKNQILLEIEARG